jgi:excisionase family DNA binding protein
MRTIESLFYTAEEMCKVLGLSRATLDRMTKRKAIPGKVKMGQAVKYHKSTIHRWINEQVSEGVPA